MNKLYSKTSECDDEEQCILVQVTAHLAALWWYLTSMRCSLILPSQSSTLFPCSPSPTTPPAATILSTNSQCCDLSALVSWGCYNKTHWPVSLSNEQLFFTALEARKSMIKVLADSRSGGVPFPHLRAVTFSFCPHMVFPWFMKGEKGGGKKGGKEREWGGGEEERERESKRERQRKTHTELSILFFFL